MTSSTPTTPARRRRNDRSALSNLVQVTQVLAWTDFKLRYAGSVLGYFWSVSKPLLLFGVLYGIFTHVLRFGDGIPHYPVMLLFAIVLWSYFTEVTGRAVSVLVGRADVLRKVAIPRIALPLSISFTSLLIMAFNLLAVMLFVFANDVQPRVEWLLLIPLILQLVLFSLGVSLLLCVWFVSLRDIGQIWDLALQLLFYASPIIYPLTLVPDSLRPVLLANPTAQIIQQSREALVGVGAGSYADAMPGLLYFLPYGITAVVIAVGVWSFARIAPTVAERL